MLSGHKYMVLLNELTLEMSTLESLSTVAKLLLKKPNTRCRDNKTVVERT